MSAVPLLGDDDVSGILSQWLAARRRRLTSGQQRLVEDAFRACKLPLFLKLAFDTAVRWRSHTPPEHTVLQVG